jgi:hypothetical protein
MLVNHRRWVSLTLMALFSFLLLSSTVFAAEPPKIQVVPSWRPGTTLDTIDNNGDGINTPPLGTDDFRYVDVDIYVTTTVQFWSVQLTCTVTPTALTSYNFATGGQEDDGDTANATAPVIWGPTWGAAGADYAPVVDNFDAVKGSRTITATKLGNTYPMGGPDGASQILLLATLRYRVKAVTLSTKSTFTCVSTFLNRNGQPVLKATYTPPPALSVLTGYVASGTVLYQGRTAHTGITVSCAGPAPFTVTTSATGAWLKNDLRSQGQYTCDMYGNVDNATPGYQRDRYLQARTIFNVTGMSYNVLPITLAGGNVTAINNPGAPAAETIGLADLNIVTGPANWNKTTVAGDVNGDGKTNQIDLAILGTNYNALDQIDSRHGIYSVARYTEPQSWQNNRLWVGKMDAGAVQQLVNNTVADSRDLWPTLSPDGKQLAFVRDVGTGTGTSTALYVAPVTNGVVGTPVRLTPANAWYQAFAPSWSPDGTRLAFICSTLEPPSYTPDGVARGHLANIGHLCLIDVTGRNWRDLAPGALARIYPPAWLTDTHLVYGGSSPNAGLATGLNTVCPDTLCGFNIQTNEVGVFDIDVKDGPSAGGAVTMQDMPVIRNNVLFYRFYDDNNTPGIAADDTRKLRWAYIQRAGWDGSVGQMSAMINSFPGGGPNLNHQLVTSAGAIPLSTDVDYYNVSSTGYNVVFYPTTGVSFRKSLVVTGTDGSTTQFVWGTPAISTVNDMAPNPNTVTHTPYDTNDMDEGDFVYGYRNTVDWVP